MIRSIAVAMTLALVAGPVFAQDPAAPFVTANEVEGAIQVNRGDGFVPLREGDVLKPGDRVMAMNNGGAELKFSDGCELEVEEETIVTVPDRSTCAGGVAIVQNIAPGGPGAVGGSAAGGVDWKGFWTIAGIVIVGDAILFAEEENDTASP